VINLVNAIHTLLPLHELQKILCAPLSLNGTLMGHWNSLATHPDQSITDSSAHYNPHCQPRESESLKYQTRSRCQTGTECQCHSQTKKGSPSEVKSNHLQFTVFCGRRSLPRFCAASMLKWHNHYETNKKLTSGHLDELIHGTRNQNQKLMEDIHRMFQHLAVCAGREHCNGFEHPLRSQSKSQSLAGYKAFSLS